VVILVVLLYIYYVPGDLELWDLCLRVFFLSDAESENKSSFIKFNLLFNTKLLMPLELVIKTSY